MPDLRAEIANALYWNLAIPRYRVTVDVDADHGLVTLRGIVERTYQMSLAEVIARRVPGVMSVRNNIAVCAEQDFSLSAMSA